MGMKNDKKEVYLLHKRPKMIFAILGLILFIQGVFRLFTIGLLAVNLLLGLALVLFGAASLIYALLNYSIKSGKAGRVELTNESIFIKQDLFKKPIAVNWEDIQAIDLGDYILGFKKKDEMYYLKYNTKKDSKGEIKNAIARIAKRKNIELKD
jgi:hypothetical protein